MTKQIDQEEVGKIVANIFEDYNGGKIIDEINIYNKPDKSEVQELVNNLFQIVYPGYFRDRTYKIYNPKNSFAVIIEDTFYHLNKQVRLALDYSKEKSSLSDEQKDEESFRIVKTFFDRIPKIREYLETDLMATFEGDPSADNYEEIILAFPGLYAITVYRLGNTGKASAVTVAMMETTSGPMDYKKATFHADRPFVYLIQEWDTRAVFFIGTYEGDL